MPHADGGSLWSSLSAAGHLSERTLWGADASVTLGDLVGGSSLSGRLEALRGRSVLVATRDQLTAALALIELDAVARRLVLCPPDLPAEHLPFVAAAATVDALVSDRATPDAGPPGVGTVMTCTPRIASAAPERTGRYQTEWVLLTSGTTGRPKMVVHTLSSLSGAMRGGRPSVEPAVWSTFYDIRRYGGLQIFLRALLGGGSMMLSSADESTGDFLIRAGGHGVTHISGTPSHWRRALMSPAAHRIAHAFASTEAGVAFDVGDGLAGFPAILIGREGADVQMKVENGSLRIRSTRTAARYLGGEGGPIADGDGFVDTGDMLERRGDRYHFVGRRGGIINVGGLKVHPEEVEAVINAHPQVRMSLVRTRKNPITGALVVADVVLKSEPGPANGRAVTLEHEIMQRCREALSRHKVPAAIHFVSALAVTPGGKLVRHDA